MQSTSTSYTKKAPHVREQMNITINEPQEGPWGTAEATCTNPVYSAKTLLCTRKQGRAKREGLVIKNEQ